ncbi:MAG: iron ABC transporter permease [Rhodothermales bacterium]
MPGILVAAGVLLPVAYLVVRAATTPPELAVDLLLRMRNLRLLGNTVLLAIGVLALTTAVALPLAWLATRSALPGRRLITLLGVLPLSIPGYVMAWVLLAATGRYGTAAQLIGLELPRLTGYGGALLALSVYTFPYLFLNLRSALLGLDVSLEESARVLGMNERQVFRRIVLPQLKPAWLAGSLLIVLHVLGDFGVVSLMRFETFSYAIYLQYTGAFDRMYAAWLALMLLGLTASLLWVDARALKNTFLARRGPGVGRAGYVRELGGWAWVAWPFLLTVATVSLFVPVGTLLHWTWTGIQSGHSALLPSVVGSISAALPASALTVMLALPVAWAGVRMKSWPVRWLDRLTYLGYAIPPLALALGVIFLSLALFPAVYQTTVLLVAVLSLHFLAEAMGPIRSAFFRTNPAIEESARLLGRTPLAAFRETVLPVIRPGIVASLAFVFLSVMKELPLSFLLSPVGFESLALNVWGYTNEAMYAQAAPHALLIVLFSALFVGLLLNREVKRSPNILPPPLT